MRFTLFLLAVLLIPGCDSAQKKQIGAIEAKLDGMSKRLDLLDEQIREAKELAEMPEHEKMRRHHERQAAAMRPKPVSSEALANITLAENPTREQVQQYVRATLDAHYAPSPGDPQTQSLLKVGPQHLDVLLDALAGAGLRSGTSSQHLLRAIEALARPEHKQLILDRLVAQPTLITVVEKMGWLDDARPLLIQGVRERPASLPSQWITHVANLRDPQTYEALKEAMVNSSQPATVYGAISKLPGIDLDDAVQRAWQRLEQRPGNDPAKATFVTIAIAHGEKDALGAFIQIMGVADTFDLHRRGWAFLDRSVSPRRVVLKHIDFHGSDAEITVWFEKNYHDIQFDSSRRVFFVPQRPAAAGEGEKAG